MKPKKLYSVAALIIYKKRYLFQKRDNKKGIFYPGLYGLFGGNNIGKENPRKTIVRELFEEIDIKFLLEKFSSNK